jgi:hypothetical protein
MQYAYAYQLNGSQAGGLDPDAKAYILAVETADGQPLESGVKSAYNNFIKGCKSDGIWNAIKSSCIIAGARTLSGALVPLKGTAPTNFNFVSGDYARKTGLVGNGSTKYLNSNRNNNSDPQNNFAVGVYISSAATTAGAGSALGVDGNSSGALNLGSYTGSSRNRSSAIFVAGATGFVGYFGTSRSLSTGYEYRRIGSSQTITQASQTPSNRIIPIFAMNDSGAISLYSNARMSFYHIGESVDLTKLDSRVTILMSNIANAIP